MSTRLFCTWRSTFCNQLRYSNQISLLHSTGVRYGPIEERIRRKLSDKLQVRKNASIRVDPVHHVDNVCFA